MCPWNTIELRTAGFTAVVSADRRCDADALTHAGLRHFPLFMPDTFPSNPKMVAEFTGYVEHAVKQTSQLLNEGEVVLVHCFAGQDRTGLILCGTLMKVEGLSASEALNRVRAVQPLGLRSHGILDVLKEYEIRHGAH